MKTRKLTISVCLVALAGSALAALQEPTPPATPVAPTRLSTYERSASSQMQSGQAVRASQVIGSTVKSSDGKIVGQIRDMVTDAQSGRIDFAVLSLSGGSDTSTTSSTSTAPTTSTTTPLSATSPSSATPSSSATSYSASAGTKLVPVPWQLFSQNFSGMSAFPSSSSTLGTGTLGGTMTLTLNIDEAKLRNAPSFDANNWSTLQGSDFAQRSYAYYGLDWNNRISATGTAGSGVSSGIGTSSSDRTSPAPGAERKPKSDTYPERRGADATAPPQAK